jgi:hypothetical protein
LRVLPPIFETLRSLDVIGRVGCVPDLRLQRLQSFLGGLYAGVPELHAEVLHLRSADQVNRLRHGTLDLGLVHAAPSGRSIETTPVFPGECLAAFLPPGHRLCRKRTVGPADAAGEVLLLFPRSADPQLHDALTGGLAAAGYRFGDVRETSGAEARDALFAAAEGHGIAVGPLPTPAVVGELGSVVVRRRLDLPVSMPDTLLAWKATPPARLADVIAAAREVAGELHRSAG